MKLISSVPRGTLRHREPQVRPLPQHHLHKQLHARTCALLKTHTLVRKGTGCQGAFSSSKLSPLSLPPATTAYISHEKRVRAMLLFLLLHWNAYWDHQILLLAKHSDRFSLLGLLCFSAAFGQFLKRFLPLGSWCILFSSLAAGDPFTGPSFSARSMHQNTQEPYPWPLFFSFNLI